MSEYQYEDLDSEDYIYAGGDDDDDDDEFYQFYKKSMHEQRKELLDRIEEDSFIEYIVDNLGYSDTDFIFWKILLEHANENTINYVIEEFLGLVKYEQRYSVFFALSNPRLSEDGIDTILNYAVKTQSISSIIRNLPEKLKSNIAKKIAAVLFQSNTSFELFDLTTEAEYKIFIFLLLKQNDLDKDTQKNYVENMIEEFHSISNSKVPDKLEILSYIYYFSMQKLEDYFLYEFNKEKHFKLTIR